MAAQRSAVLKSLEDEVKCPLCIDIFTEPKKLPCDHAICCQCLENLILKSHNGILTCPVCRNTTVLQVSGANQFQTAHQVNRLIDIYQKTLQEQSKAAPTPDATEQPQLPLCSLHNTQPLALYCETCQKTVCRDCALTSCAAKKHDYGFLKDMAKKYKEEIDKEMLPIRQLQQDISAALVAIAEEDEKLEKLKREEQKELEDEFDVIVNRLMQEKSRVLLDMEDRFTQQAFNNTSKTKELANSLDEIDSNIQVVESMTSEGNLTTKLRAQKERLRDLHRQFMTLTLKPTPFPGLEDKLKLIPESFDAKHFLFQVGKDYRCYHAEYDMLKSLKLKDPFKIDFHLTSGLNEGQIKSVFICMLDNSSTSVSITKLPPNEIRLSFAPQNRGRHELHIQLQNNTNICGSPIPSFVYVDPDQISSLGKPERTSIAEVATIKCYDNLIYVTLVGTEIIVLEPKKPYLVLGIALAVGSLSITRRIPLPGAGELLIWGQYIYYSNIYTHKVEKASMDGHILASIGGKGSLPGSFNFPNGIRITKHNEIHVCDTNNHRIQVFDTDLKLLRVIGHVGFSPGNFLSPYDLVFDEDDNIYVVKNQTNSVHVLTPQGRHIRFIGTSDTNSLILHGSACIHNGHIYITNQGRKCISVFTLIGTFVTSFGEKDHLLPECIDIDKDGYIYVTSARKNILKY